MLEQDSSRIIGAATAVMIFTSFSGSAYAEENRFRITKLSMGEIEPPAQDSSVLQFSFMH